MKKEKIILLSALVLSTVGVIGINLSSRPVYAEEDNKYPPMIQKLIEKFNLDTSEVDKLMEEEKADREKQREEMQAKHQQEIEDKLTQAVSDGKITEEQKNKILEKLAEMQQNNGENGNKGKEDLSNLTEEERKAKMEERKAEMEQRKTDLKTWEEELGIKLSDILGFDMFGGPQGHGHGEFLGNPNAPKAEE